jgi:hypothetical protein
VLACHSGSSGGSGNGNAISPPPVIGYGQRGLEKLIWQLPMKPKRFVLSQKTLLTSVSYNQLDQRNNRLKHRFMKTSDKLMGTQSYRWRLAAFAATVFCFLTFHLLSASDFTNSVNQRIFPVPLELCFPTDDSSEIVSTTESSPLLATGSSILYHAIRIYLLLTILAVPVTQLASLLGMIIFPIAITAIGFKHQKMSLPKVVLLLLSSAIGCIVLSFFVVVIILAQRNILSVCP